MGWVDLTGRKFGRLTVLRRDAKGTGRWLCQCECGSVKSIASGTLNSGHTKSCGCLRAEAEQKGDLTGKVFGRLTVLRRSETRPRHWVCRCSCGNEKEIFSGNLTRGLTKSCGCYNIESISKRQLDDMTGKKFGRLTVIKRAKENDRQGKVRWICKCDCGKTVEVTGWNLRSGDTMSCGCLHKDVMAEKHTKWRTKEEKILSYIYNSMMRRCYAKNTKGYDDYGGRGIRVCDEWRTDKAAFVRWAVSSGFKIGLSIERIDNDGIYEPSNCRWATRTEQANNRRTSKLITVSDVTHTYADWARLLGMKYIHFWKLSEAEKVSRIQSYLKAKTWRKET